jgi:hypothetical protein
MPGITEEEDQIYNNDNDEDDSKIPNPLDIIRDRKDEKDTPSGPEIPVPSP